MAGAVQWTIDQLWGGLQRIENGFKTVKADLDADKARLTQLYNETRSDTNAQRRADNQALLNPLVHQNSVLRLSYLAPIRDKYEQAIKLAQNTLKAAGYTAPDL